MLSVRLKKRRGAFELDVAFECSASGLVALFGRSGCGKSTTINLLAGLLRPDSGSIRLGDQALYDSAAGIDLAAERRRIGYMFQEPRLFPHLSVLGNLRYGEKRAPPSAHQIQLEEVVELLGLAGLLERRTHHLSGGEKRRVALGRAILSQPRLLLLDEPLAALDVARREELMPYLARLRDRLSIPIVYVSHEFDEVLRLATHVVLLEAGAVVAQGDVASVSRRAELRAIVGPEAIGAVLEGEIETLDAASGLARMRLGTGHLTIEAEGVRVGQRLRVQLLARELILAVEAPRGLSVRSALEGVVRSIVPDDARSRLVEIDIGGASVIVRVTAAASTELALAVGRGVWVLVKTVSLRGHVYQTAGA
jgi:molybdate transport system ATP-binding protein